MTAQSMLDIYLGKYPLGTPGKKREYRLVKRSHRERGAFASTVSLVVEAVEGDEVHWSRGAKYDPDTHWWFCLSPAGRLMLFEGGGPRKSGTYTILSPWKKKD